MYDEQYLYEVAPGVFDYEMEDLSIVKQMEYRELNQRILQQDETAIVRSVDVKSLGETEDEFEKCKFLANSSVIQLEDGRIQVLENGRPKV